MDQANIPLDSSPQTVLVVEDHRATRTMLVDWLAAIFPNCQCLGAGSAEEAMELVRAHGPALVVMDYALPGMNGIEATRQIKQITPRARVILLSMYEAEAYETEAVAAGASAYLFKRTMYTRFVPTVQALLSFSGDPSSNRRASQIGLERGPR